MTVCFMSSLVQQLVVEGRGGGQRWDGEEEEERECGSYFYTCSGGTVLGSLEDSSCSSSDSSLSRHDWVQMHDTRAGVAECLIYATGPTTRHLWSGDRRHTKLRGTWYLSGISIFETTTSSHLELV